MTNNRLFPLRIVPDNTEATFNAESKEEVVRCDKKENDNVVFQATFQTEI